MPANVASCIATCSHTLDCRILAIAIRGANRPLKAPEMSRARDGSHQAAARLHSAGAGIAPGRGDDALAAHGRMHVPIVPVIAGLPALLRPACKCGSGNTCPRHISRQICMPCCPLSACCSSSHRMEASRSRQPRAELLNMSPEVPPAIEASTGEAAGGAMECRAKLSQIAACQGACSTSLVQARRQSQVPQAEAGRAGPCAARCRWL